MLATEIAVCLKAVGLVDRMDLRQLEVVGEEDRSGPGKPGPSRTALFLHHALAAAVPGAVPAASEARCVADTWCCRLTPGHALVAGAPGAVDRWRAVIGRAVATTGSPVVARLLTGAQAVSIVGPRAAAVIAASALPAELPPARVATGQLADSPVAVVREGADSFLLLFSGGCSGAALEALGACGRVAGLARVGHDALAHLRAARRTVAAPH